MNLDEFLGNVVHDALGQDTHGCEAMRRLFSGQCPDHDPIDWDDVNERPAD